MDRPALLIIPACLALCLSFGTKAEAASRLYVPSVTLSGGPQLNLIDAERNAVIATRPLPGVAVDVAVDPSLDRIYVTICLRNELLVIAGSTLDLIATVPVGECPRGIIADPKTHHVYVANHHDVTGDSISVVDSTSNVVVTTISGLLDALTLAIAPNRQRLYLASEGGRVDVFDVTTNARVPSEVPSIQGNAFGNIVVSSELEKVYVTDLQGSLYAFDVANGASPVEIPLPGRPIGIAAHPLERQLYTTIFAPSSELIALDVDSNEITSRVALPLTPTGVAVDPGGDFVYVVVGNGIEGAVAVVETTTHTLTALIDVDGSASVHGSSFVGATADQSSRSGSRDGCMIAGNESRNYCGFFLLSLAFAIQVVFGRLLVKRVSPTPTSASWLNQVEGFFGIFSKQSLSLTDLPSKKALRDHIVAYMRSWNRSPTPFAWTKPATAIIRSHRRMLERISTAVH